MSERAVEWRDWRWGVFRAVLTGLFVARGVCLLCVMPPLEGWDEYQHVAYVVHIAETGQRGVLRETLVPDSLVQALRGLPRSPQGMAGLGEIGIQGYRDYWESCARLTGAAPAGGIPLYQVQHGTLYYRMAAVVFDAAGGTAHIVRAIDAMRLVNLLLVALAVWIVVGVVGEWSRERRVAGLIGLLVALQPLFLVNACRVASDALAVLLGTVVFVQAVRLAGYGQGSAVVGSGNIARTWTIGGLAWRAVLIGALLGLAVQAKATNQVLIPLLPAALVVMVLRGGASWGRAATAGVLMLAGAAAVSYSHFAFNWVHYHDLMTNQEKMIMREQAARLPDAWTAATQVHWWGDLKRLWANQNLWVGGWSFLRPAWLFRASHEYTLLIGLGGWLAWLAGREAGRRGRETAFRNPLVVPFSAMLWGCMTAAFAWYMLQTQIATGYDGANPWYAAVVLPWYLVLFVQGSLWWPIGGLRYLIAWNLVLVFVCAEINGVYGRMIPTYSDTKLSWLAIERVATLHSAAFGTATLMVGIVLSVALGAVAIGWAVRWFLRDAPAVGGQPDRAGD